MINIDEISLTDRTNAAVTRLERAMTLHSPEAKFFLAIIKVAITDLKHDGLLGDKALAYLTAGKTIYHAEMININTEWLRDTLNRLHLI